MLTRKLASLSVSFQRSLVVRSIDRLGTQMRSFNDQKQYAKALQSFHEYSSNTEVKVMSGLAISQAIKACTHLKDFDGGAMIHRSIGSRWSSNHYILASLIHFYSELGTVSLLKILVLSLFK